MASLGRLTVWFTAAALVSFNLPTLPSLHGASAVDGAVGGGHADLSVPAAVWALPPGPASLAGRQLPILFLAMGGDSYKDFMLNWAASVHEIQVRAGEGAPFEAKQQQQRQRPSFQ